MLRIYLLYIFVAIIGWFCGQAASQWLSGLNDLHWLRPAISLGVGSLAVQQAIAIKHRLGDIQAIEGLTTTERSRITVIIDLLKSETLFGVAVVFIGNLFVVITAFSNFNTSAPLHLMLASFFSVTLLSILLLLRMYWFLGNQIDSFKAQIKNRLEDKERRNSLLEKLKNQD